MFHGNVSLEIAEGLKLLMKRIEAAKIPPSKLDETLNIATWNVREFGKKRRSEAAIHYIAEIIGQFDLVGVVELRDNLQDLQRILPILGPYWDAVYSDSIRDPGGNRERICYLYDQRACTFNGMAATATPPRKKQGTEYLSEESWWRLPYVASFKAGNFDFLVFTTHVRWGDSDEARQREIQGLANWLDGKIKDKNCEDRDVIVMGDFNIPEPAKPDVRRTEVKGPGDSDCAGQGRVRIKPGEGQALRPDHALRPLRRRFHAGRRGARLLCQRPQALVPRPHQAGVHVPDVRPSAAVDADQHRH